MTTFVIIELAILLVASSFALLVMAVLLADERSQSKQARNERVVGLAEARIQELAHLTSMAMLSEIRRHKPPRKEG